MTPKGTNSESSPAYPVSVPENDTVFRLAQLLLLLDSSGARRAEGLNLERLSYYDFLTANPLLMITDENDPDRNKLIMSGFDGHALSYASPSQRFTSRRERLQHDLALLASYGLASVAVQGSVKYLITDFGIEIASQFAAMYARAYRISADIVIKRLSKLSDKRLRHDAREWIAISPHSSRPEVFDLLFTITSYDASEVQSVVAELSEGGSADD